MKAYAEMMEYLAAKRDDAYIQHLQCAQRREALGWEAKAAGGKFGPPELEAHKKISEWYGKYLAYGLLINELSRLPQPPPASGAKPEAAQ